MGDNRADIKISFTVHGKTYQQAWEINYWDNGDGIDDRIVEWFAACWHEALARAEYRSRRTIPDRQDWDRQDAARREQQERAEFTRLKAKFEGSTS